MSATEPMRAADAATRLRAQTDFATPLLVEAGAGSGKTSILVARIVAWVLGPGWERHEAELQARDGGGPVPADAVARRTLSRVVAITFTEAAAAEMAERVGQWLGRIAAGDDPGEIASEALPEPELRRRRAGPLRAALDRLVVRTIHAWCRRLLAERPLEVGLHPAFEIDADEERTGRIVREVVEHAIPHAYPDPEAPLSRLAVAGHGPSAVEEALLAWLQTGATAELLRENPFAPERIDGLLARLREACAGFREADRGRLAVAGGSRDGATSAAVDETVAAIDGLAARSLDALAGFVEALAGIWEDKSVGRLGDWARGTFGKGAGAALAGDEDAVAEAAGRLRRLLVHARSLDPAGLALSRAALAPLVEEVEVRLRAAGVESFAAILRDASRLVAAPGAAAAIRREIDQLLVDEFQDTDALQCEIVRRIGLPGDEGGEGARPTLFLVGDPRQSIYGWRSADLRAYDDFVGEVEAAGGERLRLLRNFRSLPAVLGEVKRALEDVMRPEPGVQPAFQDLLPARADEPHPGEVEHWIPWALDATAGGPVRTRSREASQLEARALAADVARRHREQAVPWQDVAILLRGMTEVDLYLDALRDAGVPYTVEQDRRYYQRREVIEASALLRAVLDPHDHVALVAWLRSASVGVPDAAWTPLWTRGFPERMSALRGPDSEDLAALGALVVEAAAAVDPGLPGLDRLAGWEGSLVDGIGTLAELRSAAETEPSDRFVERLRTATLLEATEASRYLGAYRVANLDQFFRDVAEDVEEAGGDFSEVLRRVRRAVEEQKAVEEARPRDAADEAVRVMSIHKAKGLDFTHVYLVQLHKGQGGGGRSGARLGRGADLHEYELFGARTPGFDLAAEHARRIEEAERVRTLYVAMTRARDRLVLVGKHPTKGDGLKDSHARLLEARRARGEEPASRMARLAARGVAEERDADGVLWRFPALGPEVVPASREDAGIRLPDAEAVAEASRRLAARREQARARAARPRAQAASDLSHEAARERIHARRFAEEGEIPAAAPASGAPRDATVAAAVGTAVHAALERFDATAAPEAAFEEALRTALGALPALVGEGDRATAEAEAREVLRRFADSPLAGRLREIAPHVVARELPVLLRPREADPATGHVVGAIDLLYRDPGDGAWVVADYKSDAVGSGEEIGERARRYAAQGGAYVRAVGEALALEAPPRFELWFLWPGERLSVEVETG